MIRQFTEHVQVNLAVLPSRYTGYSIFTRCAQLSASFAFSWTAGVYLRLPHPLRARCYSLTLLRHLSISRRLWNLSSHCSLSPILLGDR